MLDDPTKYRFITNAADCGIIGNIYPVRVKNGGRNLIKREDFAFLLEALAELERIWYWRENNYTVPQSMTSRSFAQCIMDIDDNFVRGAIKKDYVFPSRIENFTGYFKDKFADAFFDKVWDTQYLVIRPGDFFKEEFVSKAFAILSQTDIFVYSNGYEVWKDIDISCTRLQRTFTRSSDSISSPTSSSSSAYYDVYYLRAYSRSSSYQPPTYKYVEYYSSQNFSTNPITLKIPAKWMKAYMRVTIRVGSDWYYENMLVDLKAVAGSNGLKWIPDLSVLTPANFRKWISEKAGYQIPANGGTSNTSVDYRVSNIFFYGMFGQYNALTYLGS